MNEITKRPDILSNVRQEAASQATNIEESRAIAEVQGALVIAQKRPRDYVQCRKNIIEACRTQEVAQFAFFRMKRGTEIVSGPTIHLATELARIWGNMKYGLTELERNDIKGQSEMVATAWDLETNALNTASFIVPHKRDKKGSAPVPLTNLNQIYENNANMGSRRLRECILKILPTSLVELAKTECHRTLEHGGEKKLIDRLAELVGKFDQVGISRERIEKKMGTTIDQMTPVDGANLQIMLQSIARGEITAEEEFPLIRAEAVNRDIKKPLTEGNQKSNVKNISTDKTPTGTPPSPQSSEDWLLDFDTEVHDATTKDELDDIKKRYADDIEKLPKAEKTKAETRLNNKYTELS